MATKRIGVELFRLSPEVSAVLSQVAAAKNFSEQVVLEDLVRKEAIRMGIIQTDHPEAALGELLEAIVQWGEPAHEDFTLRTFERIAATEEALRLWKRAITPLPGQRADKRRQSVNQRLGRFCKRLAGWESAEEKQLGTGSISLIRSFTRLKPPTSSKS